LNLYGDMGNVLCLQQRATWRGIDFTVDSIEKADFDKKYCDYDLFFIGGGQDAQQDYIAKDFLSRASELQSVIEAEKPLLAICGGYQLLGSYFETSGGEKIPGLGILDVYTKARPESPNARQDRLIGNVVAELLIELDPLIKFPGKTLVGFENHSGRTYIGKRGDTKALAKIIKGFGNNAEDAFEGAVYKNLIGTYLHGSLLPKNPHLADEILLRALKFKYRDFDGRDFKALDDSLELAAHKVSASLSKV
jgi:CobQ-like glutamine amidotransferase family enzyme